MAEKDSADVFDLLVEVLQDRKQNPGENSYTSSLFAKGDEKICSKISEEAAELVEAALQPVEDIKEANDHLVHEATDLLFHTLVLMVHKGLGLDSIRLELQRRFGISGLDEKASRQP